MSTFSLIKFFKIMTSQIKSQLISAVCLHFFQKNCKTIIFFTTFWELHNCHFWIAICLHFWNQLIYVLIQKCKQKTNSRCQLCNSQNLVKNIMVLQFFEKNVNKQLKSADFLSEMSKFQKKLLNKVLTFFILMSDHTFVIVAQPPNSQKISCQYPLGWSKKFESFHTKNLLNSNFLCM